MNDEIKLFACGVLAASYRGRDLSQRALLSHAVSDAPLSVGRLKREAGEALCNRDLGMCGESAPIERVDCPKCLEIIARLSK